MTSYMTTTGVGQSSMLGAMDAEHTYPNATDTNFKVSSSSFDVVMKTIVLPTIFSIVCIVGLIGNGLVIYIMHLKVRNRNITDLYVLNLAIADFIFVSMLPFWTSEIALRDRWIFGEFLCKLTSGSTYFHMYASVFFLTTMSVDRFLAVVMYQSCRRTKTSATIGVAVIWMISTVLGLLPMFFRDVIPNPKTEIPGCSWTFDSNIKSHSSWFLVYIISRSIIGFAVPFFIILVSYSLIIIFLKTRETRGRLTSQCQDRATRMVLVVIGVFLLCWLPNQISYLVYVAQSLNIVESPKEESKFHYYIHLFSTWLAWMHSCINPILYAFMREDMRLKLTEIVNHNIKRCCGDPYRRSDAKLQESRADPSRQARNSSNMNRSDSDSQDKNEPRGGRCSVTESLRLTTIGYRPANEESELESTEMLRKIDHNYNCPTGDEQDSKQDMGVSSQSLACQLLAKSSMPSPILEESSNDDVTCDVNGQRDVLTVQQEDEGVKSYLDDESSSFLI